MCLPACPVVSDSLQHSRLQPTRILCPWDSPGSNNGVGCHFLLQGIFLTQGLNLHLLRFLSWQADSWPLSHLRSPRLDMLVFKYGEFTQIKGTLYFTIFSQNLNIKKYILETWYVYHNQIPSSFSPIDVDLYIPPNFPLNVGFEKL